MQEGDVSEKIDEEEVEDEDEERAFWLEVWLSKFCEVFIRAGLPPLIPTSYLNLLISTMRFMRLEIMVIFWLSKRLPSAMCFSIKI